MQKPEKHSKLKKRILASYIYTKEEKYPQKAIYSILKLTRKEN